MPLWFCWRGEWCKEFRSPVGVVDMLLLRRRIQMRRWTRGFLQGWCIQVFSRLVWRRRPNLFPVLKVFDRLFLEVRLWGLTNSLYINGRSIYDSLVQNDSKSRTIPSIPTITSTLVSTVGVPLPVVQLRNIFALTLIYFNVFGWFQIPPLKSVDESCFTVTYAGKSGYFLGRSRK